MPRIPVEEEATEDNTQPETSEITHDTPVNYGAESYAHQRRGIRPAAVLATLLIIGLLGMCGYLYNEKQDLTAKVAELSARPPSSEDEAADLKREVGSYIQLPDNELPTIATVVDVNKVKDQAFFAKSENGDKVLIFVKSGKAILYRPSTKKIIEIAPINLNQEQTNTTPSNR